MTSADCSHNPSGPVLVLNGCEERLQMAVGTFADEGAHLLASSEWTVPGKAVGFIAPGIDTMLKGLDIAPADFTGVACVRGPGSFTGLRLILAAAAGFAVAHGIPTAGLDYLPAIAAPVMPLHTGTIHIATYARRGQVYLQHFQHGTALGPTIAAKAPEAVQAILDRAENGVVLGSGVRKNPDEFSRLADDGVTLLPQEMDVPSPHGLLEAARNACFTQQDIEPLYIRVSDAEENLPFIAAKRGLDPEEARKKLHQYE